MIDDLLKFRAPRTFDMDPGLAYDLFWIGLIVACILL